MADTYCGKSCEECVEREEMNCPGCGIGPGKKYGGNCKLAKCARDKGHEACDTCSFHTNCRKYANRYDMPEERRREREAEAMRQAGIARKAPILGKWLWLLFWLVVPDTIGSILANAYTGNDMPGVYACGIVVQFLSTLIYGIILLKLVSEDDRYLAAGVCTLIGCFAGRIVSAITDDALLTLLASLPILAVRLYGVYSEYMAHSAVLSDVDPELGQKWETLWKWYLGLNIGMSCAAVLILIPVLGPLVVLSIVIGIVVIGILKLVYLYRTAKTFRDYSVDL